MAPDRGYGRKRGGDQGGTGTDRTRRRGWLLPAGAEGLCTYDGAHGFLTVEIPDPLWAELGADVGAGARRVDPQFGALDPMLVEMALRSPGFLVQGALYSGTMARALVAHQAATMPEIDASRISGLGICASAGYMVDAATGNPLVASVGLVAPWLQNQAIVEAVYGGAEGVAMLRGLAAEAANTPGGVIIPAAGPVEAEGVLMPIGGYYYDPARGAIPAYDDKWNNLGWESWLTYLPADNAPAFDKPLAIVHSEAAAIPDGVRAFLVGYAGQAVVNWLDNVDQFSFYDREDAVDAAADTVAQHFGS